MLFLYRIFHLARKVFKNELLCTSHTCITVGSGRLHRRIEFQALRIFPASVYGVPQWLVAHMAGEGIMNKCFCAHFRCLLNNGRSMAISSALRITPALVKLLRELLPNTMMNGNR
jgi:hypothetical protein